VGRRKSPASVGCYTASVSVAAVDMSHWSARALTGQKDNREPAAAAKRQLSGTWHRATGALGAGPGSHDVMRQVSARASPVRSAQPEKRESLSVVSLWRCPPPPGCKFTRNSYG